MRVSIDRDELRAILGPSAADAGDLAALAEAIGRPAAPCVRVNTLAPPVEPQRVPGAVEPIAWYDRPAYRCEATSRPAADALFFAGAYYVQDAASLLPVRLLDPRPGEVVCDLCAAPGGKATAIVERLGDAGWLLANEPVRSRVPPLLLNLARHGAARWAATSMDPAALADALGPTFDAVLVDAPCTGQSLLGRGKQTGRAFDAKLIEHSAARQRRILDAAMRLLRPGGRIVYATCTFAWAENEAQIEALAARAPMLRPDPLAALEPWRCGEAAPAACYRLWPHRDGCAGVFAARFVADEAVGEQAAPRGGRSRGRSSGRSRETWSMPADWGRLRDGVRAEVRGERVFGWAEGVPPGWHSVVEAGPEIAHRRGRTWFPSYALAMRRDEALEPCARVALDAAGVQRYVRGLDVPGAARGWAVVMTDDWPLGWAKGDGRTLKNHLPKSARAIGA